MKDDAPHRGLHPRTELQQPQAQHVYLGSAAACSAGSQPQLLHEDVGGRGHEHAKLVGVEARATRSVDLEADFQLLDAVLDVPSGTVDRLVNPLRRTPQIRHDEARVVLRLTPGMGGDIGFDENAPLTVPAARPIPALSVGRRMIGVGGSSSANGP